jgi:hypothetical protein
MSLFNRKSQRQRLLETVNDSLDPLKDGLPRDKIVKAGLIAGALAALTAASAGISSLRRRTEGAGGDS